MYLTRNKENMRVKMAFNLVSKQVTSRKVSLSAMETPAGKDSLLGTITMFCMIITDGSND
jgi:hypothetical protein